MFQAPFDGSCVPLQNMRLERSFSIERFQSYTTSNIDKIRYCHVLFLCDFSWRFFRLLDNLYKMSRKDHSEDCLLCKTKFLERRHRHTQGWSSSMIDFVRDESGLNIGNNDVYLWGM